MGYGPASARQAAGRLDRAGAGAREGGGEAWVKGGVRKGQ